MTSTSKVNPVGWVLAGIFAVLIVGASIWAIIHAGMSFRSNDQTIAGRDWNLDKLLAEAMRTPEVQPTPAPFRAQIQEAIVPQATPIAKASPRPKSELELWREQEAIRARTAKVMVDILENVKEIPSQVNPSNLRPPPSPWTVDEGTTIQAALLFGINSDYPGDLVALITSPLYDSATGRSLLIPAGSKLIGKFQTPMGPFQERISIDWHRLILPNNWSMTLPHMPSTDSQGYAAVGGEVNHHYLATMGAALFSSVLSIGPMVGSTLAFSSSAVSPYSGGIYQTNPEQQMGMLMANSAASRLGGASQKWVNPYLERRNTITIPAGTQFDVFCRADLVLPAPYEDHAGFVPLPSPQVTKVSNSTTAK